VAASYDVRRQSSILRRQEKSNSLKNAASLIDFGCYDSVKLNGRGLKWISCEPFNVAVNRIIQRRY